MGLLDNSAGNDQLKAALDAIRRATPTQAQLTLPELQKYVAAGILTPAQYQAISANPQAYSDSIAQTQDNTGKNAQSAALQQLGSVVQSGGSTPINEANLRNNINTTNQAMQAARGGIRQNAQERNVSGGGLEFIQQLMNEQNNSQNANMGAVNAGANNAQLALNALTQQGTLGGQMQGQSNQMSQAQADAAQQIAEYNSQLQSQANQYNTQNQNQAQQMNLANAQNISNQNTGNANMRTQYNTQVPQQMFQNALGTADQFNKLGQQESQQQGQQNAFTGNMIGTGATILGGMYGGPAGAAAGNAAGKAMAEQTVKKNNGYAMGGEVNGKQCYAEGGEVHDHQLCMQAGGDVPGQPEEMGMDDSTANDTVDAKLSPGEIVLPRSVAQSPTAPQDAQQFVSQTKGMGMPSPTVNSFAEALAKLEENGLELRLAPKGM
jgi:hypothetical protein